MGDFSVITLGVGDAFSARYYSSALVLEAEGSRILIDCPHPIRKILREAGESVATPLDLDSIDAIALTHLHADHSSGLEGFSYYTHYVLGSKPKPLIAHPQVLEYLWDGHLLATMGYPKSQEPNPRTLEDCFDVTPIVEGQTVHCGPFAIECHLTEHVIPTTGFRIRAAGRSLGYSADTAYLPELIEWLSSSDLIIHETNYGRPHTPYESLVALPEEIRQKMRLIHYPDDFDVENSVIEPLVQGRRYIV